MFAFADRLRSAFVDRFIRWQMKTLESWWWLRACLLAAQVSLAVGQRQLRHSQGHKFRKFKLILFE